MLAAKHDDRRERYRKDCQPRPLDLCSFGDHVVFYEMVVVDESPEGLGCVLEDPDTLPRAGSTLDWCGLKRYEVRWTSKGKDGKARIGLHTA